MNQYLKPALDRYSGWAIGEQTRLYSDPYYENKQKSDKQAIDAANNIGASERAQITRNWLNSYSVLQGLDNESRDEIVKVIHAFYDSDINFETPANIDNHTEQSLDLFRAISERLASLELNRSFISLASKALWCRFPDTTPLYDQFALAAITYIHKLNLEKPFEFKRINRPRQADKNLSTRKSNRDIMEYEIYLKNYIPMYYEAKAHIVKKMKDVRSDYKYPIRVFDKTLWAFGSPTLDLPYRGEIYDRWRENG